MMSSCAELAVVMSWVGCSSTWHSTEVIRTATSSPAGRSSGSGRASPAYESRHHDRGRGGHLPPCNSCTISFVRTYVGVTDNDWFRFLKDRPDITEVNFWQPSGGREFRVLMPGEPFFFKTHYPHNKVVGGGFSAI